MSLKPIALIVLFTATASPLFADENLCETKGSNGMVALVLCPPGLDQSAWKDAGVAACDTRAPCGAWIWEDASAMPETAPERSSSRSGRWPAPKKCAPRKRSGSTKNPS